MAVYKDIAESTLLIAQPSFQTWNFIPTELFKEELGITEQSKVDMYVLRFKRDLIV